MGMRCSMRDYLFRALRTFWQAFFASLSVAQLSSAITGGQLTNVEKLLLAAFGAALVARQRVVAAIQAAYAV